FLLMSIILQNVLVEGDRYLSLSLKANTSGLNKLWSCGVMAKCVMWSHMDRKAHKATSNKIWEFSSVGHCWGFTNFISIEDLFDAESGYVKDDAILVSIDVRAFPNRC
ncbi:hypothetical protein PFISCL1PPCAC_20291, partial [Pristionchus fissidentatus]